MQMKGTWLMKDVLEVTTMVKRYHDADLRFVFVVAAGMGRLEVSTLGYEPNLFSRLYVGTTYYLQPARLGGAYTPTTHTHMKNCVSW